MSLSRTSISFFVQKLIGLGRLTKNAERGYTILVIQACVIVNPRCLDAKIHKYPTAKRKQNFDFPPIPYSSFMWCS